MDKIRISIVLAILAALTICGILFYQLGSGSHHGILRVHGNVDIRQVELGFRVGGRLQSMNFEEGDYVKKGAVLAELDKTPFEHDFANQQALLAQAQANYEKMKTGSRPEEIRQAQSLVKEKEAAFLNAQINLRRQEDLVSKGLTSKQAFDDASTRMKEDQAQLKTAQEGLALANEGFRVEDITAAKAALDAALARLEIAKTNLADTQLVAPEPGTILTRIKEPGSIVGIGSPVYTLTLTQPIWVRSYISEVDLGRVKPGAKASVYTDTYPNRPLIGQVGYISPQAEFTPKNIETKELRSDLVYRIRITVNDPEGILRQGMPVTVTIDTPA